MSGDRPTRPRLAIAGLGVLLLGAIAAAYLPLRSSPEPKPNLLLVTFDTTRADHLPAYGYGYVDTPAIDRMARDGTRYARCYSPAPLTLPAHASIMTGLYPFSHGIRANGANALGEGAETLAEVLRGHGYDTAAVVGAQVLASEYGLAQGFDHYDDDFRSDLRGDQAPSKFRYVERNAGAITDAAIAWLDHLGDSPFFLWTHYFDPHMPYETPGYDPATATATPYDMEIAYADAQLDRLMQRISEIELATQRPTVVVFTADHGESLWSHGEPTHGFFVYNETLHVPLIVLLPDATERGVVIDTPVSLVDLYPSILAWLGLALPYDVDGIPLAISSAHASDPARALYFESHVAYESYGWSPLEGVIVGNEKLIAAPKPELYDLASDPGETHNRFAEAESRGRFLERSLQTLKQPPLGRPPLTPGPPQIDDLSIRMLQELGYGVRSAGQSERSRQSLDPKDGIELHRRVLWAQTELAEGRFAASLEALESVLETDPNNARAMYLVLELQNEDEVRAGVVRFIERRMEIPLFDPFNRLLPFYLGVARGREGRWDEAERALLIALERDPEDPETNYYLARALREQEGRAEAALAHFDRAHELDPANLEYSTALEQLAEELGDLEHALRVAERSYQENPDHPMALNNSAWLRYRAGREPEIALARIERALRLEPTSVRFQHTHGCVLLWLNRPEVGRSRLRGAGALRTNAGDIGDALGCPPAGAPASNAIGAAP